MRKIVTLFFVLFVLSANAAIITNVMRLSEFGTTNFLSPTGLVAVAPFFNGTDHLKAMPADSFLRTAGSNVLLEITNFVKAQDTIVSNGVVNLIINTSNSLFNVSVLVSNGVISQLIVLSNNLSSAGFARLEVQTNSVRLGLVTNLNLTYGITGSVSSATAILGVDDSAANSTVSNGLAGFVLIVSNSLFTSTTIVGKTNFINLSPQAAKLPSTNYPGIDAGWQAWETVYYETNAEGNRASLEANWQFVVPPDFATNSMQLLINYSLLATNGPNTSNVIFGVSCIPVRSGTTNNVHTNSFGFTAWGTNNWIAKYDGTNIVTNLVISLGTNAAIMLQDLCILRLSRDAVNDTYGGAASVHALQLMYTRQ